MRIKINSWDSIQTTKQRTKPAIFLPPNECDGIIPLIKKNIY